MWLEGPAQAPAGREVFSDADSTERLEMGIIPALSVGTRFLTIEADHF
jgi:hypothetical protein